MNYQASDHLKLHNDLVHAIERNELTIYYQPRLHLHSGRVSSVEALIRWRHPERGLLHPQDFIPLAEELGLINQIGEWVIRNACKESKTWHRSPNLPIRLAINISATQLNRRHLQELIFSTLYDLHLEPESIELELTESQFISNPDAALETLKELREFGVDISIDDFGTGYSAFSYLKSYPVNRLKIDQSFLKNIPQSKVGCAIVQAIIKMAHSLDLQVTAEGVETPDQLKFLRHENCDEVQGYFISKPLTAEDFRLFLDRNRRWNFLGRVLHYPLKRKDLVAKSA